MTETAKEEEEKRGGDTFGQTDTCIYTHLCKIKLIVIALRHSLCTLFYVLITRNRLNFSFIRGSMPAQYIVPRIILRTSSLEVRDVEMKVAFLITLFVSLTFATEEIKRARLEVGKSLCTYTRFHVHACHACMVIDN